MNTKRPLIRNMDAEVLLEIFMVAAVAAILLIRFSLRMTHYPQLGGGGLHIAHMLWGGLMMLMALVLMLAFLNRGAMRVAALLGGVGFGTFLDEVGKFITKDNDYFYQPSVAIIYVVFVLLGLGARTILRRSYTREEYLLNALRELEELALHDMDERERGRVEDLLRRSDPANPLVTPLAAVLRGATVVPDSPPGDYERARVWVRDRYARLVCRPRFLDALVLFFVVQLAIKIVTMVLVVFFPWVLPSPDGGPPRLVTQRLADLTFADWGQLVTTFLSGIFVAVGVAGLPMSRRFAYRMFANATLITILLTQVFMFYERQFAAVVGLVLNVLVVLALQAALEFERQSGEREVADTTGIAAVAKSAFGRKPA